MERVLKVDPEFQNKIPPLTADEFKQLEENIMAAGEVYEPITVWNNTIVDGHNRYTVVLLHPGIRWKIRDVKFADKWEAFDWMYKNQLGRRNLTDEQKTFLIGKLYEARKHAHGGTGANQYTKAQTNQNDKSADNKQSWVVNQIAEEEHVGPATVKRAEYYAKGIEAIRAEDSALADAILRAEKKVPKVNVIEVGQAEPHDRQDMVLEIKERGTVRRRSQNKSTEEIKDIVEGMTDDSGMKYTIHMMKEQIQLNADMFIRSLSNMLHDHSDLYAAHTAEIDSEIDNVINRIEILKGDIE